MNFDLKAATPMMAQWYQCRQKAKGALLLFRMGDFYEAFYEDAEVLAKALDLTLTKRQEIPMSGIPHHAFQNYIDRLLAQGLKVAVAEQTEDPKKAKGLVKRDIVRIITPGTLLNSNLLTDQSHNYLASICQIGAQYGFTLLDISTADFRTGECNSLRELAEMVYSAKPSEIILPKKLWLSQKEFFQEIQRGFNPTFSPLEDWKYNAELSLELLLKHFNVHSLDGLGLKGMMASINSAGALLTYLQDDLCLKANHIQHLKKIEEHCYLLLDHITLNHLEILEPQSAQNKNYTLYHHINQTQTAMGARLLKEWVQKPLLSVAQITERQDAIENLLQKPYVLTDLKLHLKSIADIERLMMKISTHHASARDFNALKNSLKQLPKIKTTLVELSTSFWNQMTEKVPLFDELCSLVEKALVDEPPLKLGDGKTFNQGYNEELDEYTLLSQSSKKWLSEYQLKLRESTQIKTLKVGYNRVFGYYIEVSKGQAHLMPETFHRRQTLANNERFISEELKTFETKVLSAEEKISALETRLFDDLREKVLVFQDSALLGAQVIAQIDCIVSLAILAERKHYVKPLIDEGSSLKILRGRHPILDELCSFIPNDTALDNDSTQMALITGPNMAGKSTYIRQVALLVIMAQMGSFIPAESAHIGIVDKIFSRIGASDDLARGQSTFMVEMVETANILNNLSEKSLVILDEIGRGTSTYDGIAIAQSTAEFLLQSTAKTLFATHYSELTELAEKNEKVKNFTVAVHEEDNKITFLYKIIAGSTDQSYGIHVAELAGLPTSLILRARKILKDLEHKHQQPKKTKNAQSLQLSFLPKPEHPIVEAIQKVDPNHLTPIEALELINQLQQEHL